MSRKSSETWFFGFGLLAGGAVAILTKPFAAVVLGVVYVGIACWQIRQEVAVAPAAERKGEP